MEIQLQQKQNEIEKLTNQLENEVRNSSLLAQQKQNEIQKITTDFNGQRNQLSEQIRQKQVELETKTAEFIKKLAEKDEIIIKKLSEGYADYVEKEILPERGRWQVRSFWSFIILSVVVVVTIGIFIFCDKLTLDKKVALFSLDVIAVSLVWFCVNQYSYYTKFYTEYSNRKVVASSYLGVIGNIDHELKKEATKVIVDTLFSRSFAEIGSELPMKEVTKLLNDLMGKKRGTKLVSKNLVTKYIQKHKILTYA